MLEAEPSLHVYLSLCCYSWTETEATHARNEKERTEISNPSKKPKTKQKKFNFWLIALSLRLG